LRPLFPEIKDRRPGDGAGLNRAPGLFLHHRQGYHP